MSRVARLRASALSLYDQYGEPVKPFVHRLFLERGIGFIRRTGLKVVELSRGKAVLRMPLKGNTNHIGTMYAGALFTLAEVPGGALFFSSFDTKRYYPIVTEMTIRYLKPAKGAITAEVNMAEDEIIRLQDLADREGKAKFELEAELRDAAGQVVAISKGQYQLRRRDQ